MLRPSCIGMFIAVVIISWSAAPAIGAWSDDPTINLPVNVIDGYQQVTASSGVSDGDGGAIIFWVHEPYSAPEVWAQRVSDDGEILWAADGVPVCTAPGAKDRLQVLGDCAGGAIAIWRDRRGSDYDFYGQRIDADGNTLWPVGAPSLDAIPVSAAPGEQESLTTVPDGAGGVIVVWRHDDFVDDGVFAQRIDPDGNRLWPSGAPSDDGAIVCDHAHAQFNPSATPDGSGGVIVAWNDSRNSATTNHDIYAQRLDSDGNSSWSADGVPVTRADLGQTEPLLAATGTGGAIVIWKDYRAPGAVEGIAAQRISAGGLPVWADDVFLTEEFEGTKGIVSDGAGGAYVVWRDRRFINVTDRDLFAQRLGPNGTKLWGVGDLPVVVEDDSQSNFDLLSVGSGGLYVAWTDSRTGSLDIYAQHISSGGTFSGPANGIEICTDPEWQGGSTIVGGAGGLIIAWNDYRNTATATDIYAHKVFDDGIFDDGFETGDTGEWDVVFP